MSEINLNTAATIQTKITTEDFSKLMGANTEKAKDIISKTMEILAGASVRVTNGGTAGVDGNRDTGRTSGATGTPALDNPGDAKNVEANLEKLIAFLQLDNEEQQAEMAKDRINNQKARLDTEHKGRMEKINESLEKIDKAEKSRKASRFFSWLGAIFSVIAAVVTTIVTGGVAAGFAIAGAVIAVGSLVASETGATDKLIELVADSLEKNHGYSSTEAKKAASLIINLTIMGAGLICSIGALGTSLLSAADTVKNISSTMKTIQTITQLSGTVVGIGGMASGAVSTGLTYDAEKSRADVTELQKFITMMQQQLEESEEELQQLLQMIQQSIGQIAELITSATDTSSEIAQNIGAMA
jgi:hypothetical protein